MNNALTATFATVLLVLMVACGVAEAPTNSDPPPTLKTPVSFSAPISRPNLNTDRSRIEAVVVNVVDGDTIDVTVDGVEYRVRYIGIDTPETVHPTRGVEPYGKEASVRNVQLVEGKTVYLEKDVSETDQYGRLLRYVWLEDGSMVNETLVAEGYAQVATYPPDVRYTDRFTELQRVARAEGRGLWVTAESASTEGGCDAAYPDVCIPPPPPDLDCGEMEHRNFQVLPPDPHRFDGDKDGVGCER